MAGHSIATQPPCRMTRSATATKACHSALASFWCFSIFLATPGIRRFKDCQGDPRVQGMEHRNSVLGSHALRIAVERPSSDRALIFSVIRMIFMFLVYSLDCPRRLSSEQQNSIRVRPGNRPGLVCTPGKAGRILLPARKSASENIPIRLQQPEESCHISLGESNHL